jgi:hypothetical protein
VLAHDTKSMVARRALLLLGPVPDNRLSVVCMIHGVL